MSGTMTADYAKSLLRDALMDNLDYEQLLDMRAALSVDKENADKVSQYIHARFDREYFSGNYKEAVEQIFTDDSYPRTYFKGTGLGYIETILQEKETVNTAKNDISAGEVFGRLFDEKLQDIINKEEKRTKAQLAYNAKEDGAEAPEPRSLAELVNDYAYIKSYREQGYSDIDILKYEAIFEDQIKAKLETLEKTYTGEGGDWIRTTADLDALRFYLQDDDKLQNYSTIFQGMDINSLNADKVEILNRNALVLNKFAQDFGVDDLDDDIKEFWQRLEIKVSDLDGRSSYLADADEKQKYLEALLHSSLSEVMRENMLDTALTAQVGHGRTELSNAAQEVFINKLMTSVLASGLQDKAADLLGVESLSAEELKDPAKVDQYNRAVFDQWQATASNPFSRGDFLNNMNYYLENNDAAETPVNSLNLLAGHAEEDIDMEGYTRRLQKELIKFDIRHNSQGFNHAAPVVATRQHQKVKESGKAAFGEKNYKAATTLQRFISDHPGKTMEILGSLTIAGGSAALALGVSATMGYAISGAMVAQSFAKTLIYPVKDQQQALKENPEYQKKGKIGRYLMAFREAKKQDKHIWVGASAGILALGAITVGSAFAGPIGARAGAGVIMASANAFKVWRETADLKKMYKKTGDPKYLEALQGSAYAEKIAGSKGWKKLWYRGLNLVGKNKKRQRDIAVAGAGVSALLTGVRVLSGGYDQMVNSPTVTSLDAQTDPILAVQPDSTTIAQPDSTTIVQPDTTTIAQPDSTTIAQPDTTTIAQPDSTTIAQPDTTTIAQPDSTTIVQPDSTTISQPDTTTVIQPTDSLAAQKLDSLMNDYKTGLSPQDQAQLDSLLKAGNKEEILKFVQDHPTQAQQNLTDNLEQTVQQKPQTIDLHVRSDGTITGNAAAMDDYKTPESPRLRALINRQTLRSDFDDYSIVDGKKVESAADYIGKAKTISDQLEGKPEGMTVEDYVFHRQMLREYIGITNDKVLSGDLKRLGISRDEWNSFMAGTADQAMEEKIFNTRLGAYAARLLIDRDIANCDELTTVQINILRRGLSLVNMDNKDQFSSGMIGYVKAPGMVSYDNNPIRSVSTHYHVQVDCDGNEKVVRHLGTHKAAPVPVEKKIIEPIEVKEPEIEPVAAPVAAPEPVVAEVPLANLEFSEHVNGYTPATQTENGLVVNRFRANYGANVSSGEVYAPKPKDFLSYDKAGKHRVDLNDLPLKEPNKKGEIFVDLKKGLPEAADKKVIYWQNEHDGSYVPVEQSWRDMVLKQDAVRTVSAPDLSYNAAQVTDMSKTLGVTANVMTPLKGDPDKFLMVTERGIITGVRQGDKVDLKLVDFQNKPTTSVPVEAQKELFAKAREQIAEMKLKSAEANTVTDTTVQEQTAAQTEPATAAPRVERTLADGSTYKVTVDANGVEHLNYQSGDAYKPLINKNPRLVQELTSKVYKTPDGKYKVLGYVSKNMGAAQLQAKTGLEDINMRKPIIEDILARQSSGETLTQVEKNYVKQFNNDLNRMGIDKNFQRVQTPVSKGRDR